VEDLACRQDSWTAKFAAKRLEIRTPLHIEGDSWSVHMVLAPLFIGCATLAFLFWLKRAVRTLRQMGLELKVPPVAIAVIMAALMWCVQSATPDFDFPFPSNLTFRWVWRSLAYLRVSPVLLRSGQRRPP
jgi:hypothetical protein